MIVTTFFISLCASFDASLIHCLGTFIFTDIDHVIIMKSSICPTPKRGGITDQSESITCQRIWEFNPARFLQWQYRFKDQEMYGDPYPASRTVSSHESYVNLRPSRKIAAHSQPIGAQYKVSLHSTHTSWKLASSMRTSQLTRLFLISSLVLSVLISILSLECSQRLISSLTLHSHR